MKQLRFWFLAPARALTFGFFLIPLAIVVLYSFNVAELPIHVVVSPILITLPIVITVWALLTALLRHRRKAALITSLGILLFFSYGY